MGTAVEHSLVARVRCVLTALVASVEGRRRPRRGGPRHPVREEGRELRVDRLARRLRLTRLARTSGSTRTSRSPRCPDVRRINRDLQFPGP